MTQTSECPPDRLFVLSVFDALCDPEWCGHTRCAPVCKRTAPPRGCSGLDRYHDVTGQRWRQRPRSSGQEASGPACGSRRCLLLMMSQLQAAFDTLQLTTLHTQRIGRLAIALTSGLPFNCAGLPRALDALGRTRHAVRPRASRARPPATCTSNSLSVHTWASCRWRFSHDPSALRASLTIAPEQ